MRMPRLILAAIAALTAITAAGPAAAETGTVASRVVIAPAAVAIVPLAQDMHQYRDRRYGYRRGDGYRPGYRRPYYRGGYRRYGYRPYYRPYNRGWRGRTVCRTVWRYGRPVRRCWRR